MKNKIKRLFCRHAYEYIGEDIIVDLYNLEVYGVISRGNIFKCCDCGKEYFTEIVPLMGDPVDFAKDGI